MFDQNPNPSPGWQTVLGRSAVPGELLVALDTGSLGTELWVTDGTAQGTRFVRELVAGPAGTAFLGASSDANGSYLVVDRGQGHELWFSDGSSNGTRLLFTAAQLGIASMSAPQSRFRIGAQWLFAADGAMWISDGTPAGTRPVLLQTFGGLVPLREGSVDSTYGGMFHVTNYAHGAFAFVPGVQVPFVQSSNPASSPFWCVHRGEPILVERTTTGPLGVDVTVLTAVHRPGAPSRTIQGHVVPKSVGDRLAWVDVSQQLFAWDFVGSPVLLHPSATGACLTLGAQLAFQGVDSRGTELWFTDGTVAGTRVLDLTPGPSSTSFSFAGGDALGRHLLMWRYAPLSGWEPWISDGTVAGTVQLGDLEPGPGDSTPDSFRGIGRTASQDVYVGAVHTPTRGWELWASNATPQGSHHLAEIVPGPADGLPQFSWLPMAAGHRLVFLADDGVTGPDLWAVDVEGSTTTSWTQGSRTFEVRGDVRLGAAVEFVCTDMDATDLGAAAVGLPAAATPVGAAQTWLFVDLATSLPYLLVTPNAQGAWSQSIAVPNDAALQGLTLVAQAGFAGSAIPGGVEFGSAFWLCLGR